MKIVWNAESASKAEEPSPKSYACRAPTQPNIARNVTAILSDKEASGKLVTRLEMHS